MGYGKAKGSKATSRAEPYGGGKGGGVPRGKAPAKGNNVYVGNLPFDATWQDLKDVFRICGEVARVEIMTEGGVEGGRSKGCAIVEFRSKEAAQRAVNELHDVELVGRPMLVRLDRGGNNQGEDIPHSNGKGSAGPSRVFVGNLAFSVQWQELKDVFRECGDVGRVEIMTEGGVEGGRSKGCAIVEFRSQEGAQRAVNELHDVDLAGRPMLVQFDRGGKNPEAHIPHSNGKGSAGPSRVFVGNLAFEVQWQELKDVFRECGDVGRVEIMTEGGVEGGRSKGCAIVEFRSQESAQRAVNELHDVVLAGRPMLVQFDRGGKTAGAHIPHSNGKGSAGPGRVFVGNLAFEVQWQELKDVFRTVGEVAHVEIMTEGGIPGGKSKGCAIVEFRDRRDAMRAIAELHDAHLAGRPMMVREDAAGPAPMPFVKGGKGGKFGDMEDEAMCRVFVANLDFSVSWQDLKDHMREVGEVVFAEVMTEGGVKGGRSKGCGIVQFATLGAAQRAITRMHDSLLNGRPILVRPSMN